jgi:hypothetical protein
MEEQIIQALITAYSEAEAKLLSRVAFYLSTGIDAPDWHEQKLAQVQQLNREAVAILRALKDKDTLAKQAIVQSYLENEHVSASFISTNTDTINALQLNFVNSLTNMRYQILRSTQDNYRAIVGQASTQAALGVDVRLRAAQRALDSFANSGITGFVDRQGRQYDIRSYTEMATRTALLNAQRQGRAARLEANGKDLIIVSSHPNPSPVCAPYERKILSLSGASDRYQSFESAKAGGLFHPNCRHSFTAYVPGLTKIEAPQEADDYEQVEKQRYFERQIRQWKRREIVAIDDATQAKARQKIREKQAQLRELTRTYDLVRKSNRESLTQPR